MHVYFSGIGGVGIGPLALLALDIGATISGSDIHESLMTEQLKNRGAGVHIGQDGSHIKSVHSKQPIDWFVYSSALSEDHAELSFVNSNGIKASKRAEFLKFIIAEKNLRLIAVAGTHGKTTTTGMMIWALKQLGVPISYSIGTSINFGPPAQYNSSSEYFIYECDEFDRNFLEFTPHRSLITSYGYDHPDTYPTPDDYKYAFLEFIAQSQFTYLWSDNAKSLELSTSPTCTLLSKSDPSISTVSLPGAHTKQNAWLAAQCLDDILPNIEMDTIIAVLNTFPGTDRRFEKLTENLYSDYAHHPVEIAATIQMAQEINKNVVIVYQPHQNIRQHEIMHEGGYKDCFNGAKKVYWLPTYQSRENPELETLPPETLMQSLSDPSIAEAAEMNEDLTAKIKDHQANGDLVLAMSAGDLDNWIRRVVKDV